MHYDGDIFRPPSEANSILLQITLGCSHNKCSFCGSFKNKRFAIKDNDIIYQDIDYASLHFRHKDRLFLCDGDVMIVPQKKILPILIDIEKKMPWLKRVGLYANAKSLMRKSIDDLRELHDHGVGIVYLGLESGDDETLSKIHKKGNAQQMIEQAQKVHEAGIKLSVTVLVGLAGRSRSQIHAQETGKVLSKMDPEYVGALSLMLVPGTSLFNDYKKGTFELLEPIEMLSELRTMFAFTELSNGLFHANHASNYLPIRAKLPDEKDEIVSLLDNALKGNVPLKPEWMRGL